MYQAITTFPIHYRKGTQTIAKSMAAELKPRSLHLSTPVINMKKSADSIFCEIRTSNDKLF